jgi:murein DD-endopeptidase MepM/ murein hydrolase activator NlpD
MEQTKELKLGKILKKTNIKVSLWPRCLDLYNVLKRRFVSRLFFGRNNYYKNVSHFIMLSLTVFITISGLASSVYALSINRSLIGGNIFGSLDLLEQGGSVESVLQQEERGPNIATKKHVVAEGETLDSIAQKYGVTTDTIRWASNNIPSLFFSNNILAGWELTIPEINGVFYKVRPGQSLEQIIAETSLTNNEANRFNIVEFNGLRPPYSLSGIEKLFIPDGNLSRITLEGRLETVPIGIFIDPLQSPDCAGYSFSRGFLPYHNGVDLARWPGCPISAVANGVVEYSGWANAGQGNMVRINHGGGIKTEYFHGQDDINWVKEGDVVSQGDYILMMGSTGNSTGVHLHFILWKDGVAINPRPYVPYIGDY